MRREPHFDKIIPATIAPEDGIEDSPGAIAAWMRANRNTIEARLHDEGALLVRGFHVDTPEAFNAVATALRPELMRYVGGDSPRSQVSDRIYTSTEFPPEMAIGLHNELSYSREWPRCLFFCCLVAARSGGETPIADSRRVLAAMRPSVRDGFARLGVIYRQHLRDADVAGPGKSWQETFDTANRAEVVRICIDQDMDIRWTRRGLRTSLHNPGVLVHPVTGETCWFNQADLWHADFDTVKAQEHRSSPRESRDEALGCHALYGDGSEILTADLQAVRQAYESAEVIFPWSAGDVLILDNMLMMHGRQPFEGERRVLVAMA
jgi:alpha-ketoglutarate-dependent taurine dioxygenase